MQEELEGSLALPQLGRTTILILTFWVCGTDPSILEAKKEPRLSKLVSPDRCRQSSNVPIQHGQKHFESRNSD